MSSTPLSQEESLIGLKKELDNLGFDRNDPASFALGQADVRQRALALVDSFLEIFGNCSIALLYKSHLRECNSSGIGKRAVAGSQKSITRFFSKRPKTKASSNKECDAEAVVTKPTVPEIGVIIPCSSISGTSTASAHGLERDPGLRPLIHCQPVSRYTLLDQYLQLGPFQPRLSKYPVDLKTGRSFNATWFDRFKWLEYSIANDSAFCFPCFLFSPSKQQSGRSSSQFIIGGFKRWKNALEKNKGIVQHDLSLEHQAALSTMQTRKAKTLPRLLSGLDDQQTAGHAAQVVATANVVLHLALQGLAFRGHDEHPDSLNKGNFLENLRFLFRSCPDIPHAIPNNAKYTSPDIQRDMTWAAADIVRQKNTGRAGRWIFLLDR